MDDIAGLLGRPLFLAPGEEAEVRLQASPADVRRLCALWRRGDPVTVGGLGAVVVERLRYVPGSPGVTVRLRGCSSDGTGGSAAGAPTERAGGTAVGAAWPPARRPSAPTAPASQRSLLVAGVVLIALNLRPALAGVGPLVGEIREATGLSNAALGLLTTLPLLAFGVVSALTTLVTRRLGIDGALAAGLLLIGVGTAARAVPSVEFLYGGTVLFGVGVALGNVLLPAIVKRDFPARSGPMTSLYSSVMGLGATLGAGVSVPLASALGWPGALGVWAVLAAVALAVWLPRLRGQPADGFNRRPLAALLALGRSPLAWWVALFMGFQSLTFYVVLAWLPDLLQSRGLGAAEAGGLLALSQATGILGSAVVPLWAGRLVDQRGAVWALGLVEAVALAGLLLSGAELVTLWVGLLGVVLGGTFGLSLLFLVVRAPVDGVVHQQRRIVAH